MTLKLPIIEPKKPRDGKVTTNVPMWEVQQREMERCMKLYKADVEKKDPKVKIDFYVSIDEKKSPMKKFVKAVSLSIDISENGLRRNMMRRIIAFKTRAEYNKTNSWMLDLWNAVFYDFIAAALNSNRIIYGTEESTPSGERKS